MIAYHIPPIHESSGLQRTLKFASHLSTQGWEPVILSVNPRVYPHTSDDQMGDLPVGVPVYRAFGLDTARHLAVAGSYPRFLALPDRYASWLIGGVWTGLRLIRRYRPVAIWSTYPIATAHRIGYWLQKFSGLPWIADFRDPMAQDDYPTDPVVHKSFVNIEQNTIRHCNKAVFATPSARDLYAQRYGQEPSDKFVVIPNGYDERQFEACDTEYRRDTAKPLRLIHSGALYPSERDPSAFFEALARLKRDGVIDNGRLNIVLRATGHDEVFAPVLDELGIADVVQLAPRVAYREALDEMMSADGLLLLQAANCNQQIPAKAYEYMRTRRPILALTDPSGDTARTLREAGVGIICRLDDADDIYESLVAFLDQVEAGTVPLAEMSVIENYERSAGARRLEQLLREVVAAQQVSADGGAGDR